MSLSLRSGLSYIYIKRRFDSNNIKRRELGVSFRDLRVVGLGATTTYQPTFGSTLNPLNIIGSIQKALHPPVRDILSGFEGVVRPGEMICKLQNLHGHFELPHNHSCYLQWY